jgi:hypothetical protein
MICLSVPITSSSARIDFSRPTNSGTIICGNTTMSRRGRTGKAVESCGADVFFVMSFPFKRPVSGNRSYQCLDTGPAIFSIHKWRSVNAFSSPTAGCPTPHRARRTNDRKCSLPRCRGTCGLPPAMPPERTRNRIEVFHLRPPPRVSQRLASVEGHVSCPVRRHRTSHEMSRVDLKRKDPPRRVFPSADLV